MGKHNTESDLISISDVVQELLDRPLAGGPAPLAHRRQVEAQKIFIDRVFEEVIRQVAGGRKVKIKNFGQFSFRVLKEKARNPQTNEFVEVKKPKRLRFSASVKTESALNPEEV